MTNDRPGARSERDEGSVGPPLVMEACPAPSRRSGWRWAGYLVGGGLVVLGIGGLLGDAGRTSPWGWALWLGAMVIGHDLVLVPLVLAIGLALRRVAPPYRAALAVCGLIAFVALPVVLGLGRRADNPSQLPLDYRLNLAVVVMVILMVTAAATTIRARRRSVALRKAASSAADQRG